VLNEVFVFPFFCSLWDHALAVAITFLLHTMSFNPKHVSYNLHHIVFCKNNIEYTIDREHKILFSPDNSQICMSMSVPASLVQFLDHVL
jgi:hypothetical protein